MRNIYLIFPKDRVGDEPAMAGVVVADYDKAIQEEGPDFLDEPLIFTDFLSVILTLQEAEIVQVYVTCPRFQPEDGVKEKAEAVLRKLGFDVLEHLSP
ncbi:MAG: hypothetical protein M0R80_08720 [Proteobacteria bacterium]|jgi:hypothetical protein|nr:hypothetical protein [Pseudomonadota bacterium]